MSGWNTIESDAGVFTELVEKFGVKGVEFEETFEVSPEALSQYGDDLYGAVLLFKYRGSEYQQQKDKPFDGEYVSDDAPGGLFFAHQIIPNACATQALLSLLLNQPDAVDIGEELREFRGFVADFDAGLKGETISNSDMLRFAHNSFSRPTPFVKDDEPEDRDEEKDGLYHYVAYVSHQGGLWELDGLKPHPVLLGPAERGADFGAKLATAVRSRMARRPDDAQFVLLTMVRDKRLSYADAGDAAGAAAEAEKRDRWHRDNVLRRHNFVGLVYELTKRAAAQKTDAEWESTLTEARNRSKAALGRQ